MKINFLTIGLLWTSLTLVSSMPVSGDNGPLMIRYDLSGVNWDSINWKAIDWDSVFGNNKQPPPKNPQQPPPKSNPPKDDSSKKDPPQPDTGSNPPPDNSGKPLWGLNYSPYGVKPENYCPDAATVARQLKKVAEVTDHIRLYSTDCSQLYNALKAIKDEKLNLDVYPGIYVNAGQDKTNDDMDAFFKAVKEFGSDRVKGLSVGNEVLASKNGTSEAELIGYMDQIRSRMKAAKLDKIPLYFTERNQDFTKNLAAHSDLVQVNIYSVYNGKFTSMDDSVKSTFDQIKQVKDNVCGGKLLRIGETGWSSGGTTEAGFPLTLKNEIEYAQKFACQAAKENLEYFYFEAKDAMWKKVSNLDEIQRHFGIYTANFVPKFDFKLLSKC